MLVGFCTELDIQRVSVRIHLPCRLQPVFKKTRLPNYTVGDPRVDQLQMKKKPQLSSRSPTILPGSVGDQPKEKMNPSTTYWRTRPSLDLQDLSLPPGDPRVDHYRRSTPAKPLLHHHHSRLHWSSHHHCRHLHSNDNRTL
jgi:hypothetical protein